MKVYISGKITGDPNYRAKFKEAEKTLEREGHVPLNPAMLPDGLDQEDYMSLCIAMIGCADVAAFLPDWEQSEGAKIERAYCKRIGKRCAKINLHMSCGTCKNNNVVENMPHCTAGGYEPSAGMECCRWRWRGLEAMA